jgi:lipopolysaccharide transport system permease protein
MPTRIIYSADNSNRKFWKTWIEMFMVPVEKRDLIWQLIHQEISVRHRQSLLGYIWAVVPQLVTALIFSFLSMHRVFSMGQPPMPYLFYALWNLSVWQLFAGCLLNSTGSLVRAGTLVTKNNFPKETLILSSVGQPLFDFAIRLVPCIIAAAILGFQPGLSAMFIPLLLVFVMLMALGFGFILSIANLVMRDISNALSVVLMFGVFMAPILYAPPVREPYYLVNIINPFSPLLIGTQNLLTGNGLEYPLLVVAISAGSIVIFLLGWYLFRITLNIVVEKA